MRLEDWNRWSTVNQTPAVNKIFLCESFILSFTQLISFIWGVNTSNTLTLLSGIQYPSAISKTVLCCLIKKKCRRIMNANFCGIIIAMRLYLYLHNPWLHGNGTDMYWLWTGLDSSLWCSSITWSSTLNKHQASMPPVWVKEEISFCFDL